MILNDKEINQRVVEEGMISPYWPVSVKKNEKGEARPHLTFSWTPP